METELFWILKLFVIQLWLFSGLLWRALLWTLYVILLIILVLSVLDDLTDAYGLCNFGVLVPCCCLCEFSLSISSLIFFMLMVVELMICHTYRKAARCNFKGLYILMLGVCIYNKNIRNWDTLSLKHRLNEVVEIIYLQKSRKETMAPFDWEVSWWWVPLVLFHCSVVIIAVSYDKRCSTQFILCNMWGNCTCFPYRCRFGNTRLWMLY